jgi:hypothetical protein
MPVAKYYVWDKAGRPITPAKPIREVVERLKVAYPRSGPFSWYANEAHYQADKPQDHTPFSVTGWPIASPYPVVFATDIMHRPMEGVDCFRIFNYWIQEARAGRMPWLKYLIWQGKIYDVRNNWAAQPADDHFDHIHMSARTDYQNASLGSWILTPGGPMPDDGVDYDKYDRDRVTDTWGKVTALTTAVKTLTDMVAKITTPTPAPVDLAAVRVIVKEEINKTKLTND